MKRTIIALMMFSAIVPVLWADQIIDTRGLTYDGVVKKYRDFTVSLRLGGTGELISKKLWQIRKMEIAGNKAFNQAETLLGEKKYTEAIASYDKAYRAAAGKAAWMKRLIRDRRYQAIVAGGMIKRAVEDWIALVDAAKTDPAALNLCPTKFAPAGSPANIAAIQILDAKTVQLQKNKKQNRKYIARILNLKMKIQEADGDAAGATRTAEQITKLGESTISRGPTSPTKAPDNETQPVEASDAPDLAVLGRLLKSGKVDGVIRKIRSNLKEYGKPQLPGAMLLLGKAQLQKYEQGGKKDRKLLIQAGLNLVWVYAEFGSEPEAPEALYLAAQVNRQLNEPVAVRKALEVLVDSYDGGSENPWVTKAEKELAEMSAGK